MAQVQGSPTQSLDRAIFLLEKVVECAAEGALLAHLADATKLSKPTAHRLLTGLRHLGLVDYEEKTRLFYPGVKLYRMGLAAAVRFDITQLAQPGMQRLAAQTGDTVYLSLRSGDDAMCAARQVGAFPIRTLTLEVGDHRPLGLGAGSLALLAALPDDEVETAISRNAGKLAPHANFDPVSLWNLVRRTRKDGYSLNEGLMLPEMAAVGHVVRDPSGKAAAALSVATIKSRMEPARRESIVALLAREARLLEEALGARVRTGSAR